MKKQALNLLCAVAAILLAAPVQAQVGTNYKFIWQTPVPMAGLTSDQILNSFASSDYVAAAMCAAPTAITVTNGDGSTIVFAPPQTFCTITGGNGSTFATWLNTNALGGNTTFSNLLNWSYGLEGGLGTNLISIPNLVPGQQYIVELFSLDDGLAYNTNLANGTSWQDPTNANDISQVYPEYPGDYIIGLLNASNTMESIQQNGDNAPFNAMVVRTTGAIPPPYWILAPANIGNIYAGGQVVFTAQAAEDAKVLSVSPISYQWQSGPPGGPYTNLPANQPSKWTGTTSGTLTINNLNSSDALAYAVIASNAYGSITDLATPGATIFNEKIFWETPVPMAGLTSDQILNSFAPTDYVAAAMCCEPTAVTVTNGDGSTIVFGALQSACTITGGIGHGPGTGVNTNPLGGNTTFSNMLNWSYYDNSNHIVTLANLVPGQQYIVELFSLYSSPPIAYGGLPNGPPENTSWQDPTNASDISQVYLESPGDYIIGLLNASNTVEQIQQNLPTDYGNFNAIVVRTTGAIPPPYFIAGPTNIPPEYAGGNASFTGLAQEDTKLPAPTISYQWISGPAGGPYTNLPADQPSHWTGTTTTNLTISNLGPSDGNLTYGVVATSTYGTITDFTTIGTITPGPPPPPTNQPFPPSSTLIGEWLAGPATYAEQTGQYSGAHDAYDIKLTYTNAGAGGTNYWTNDVPPNAPAGAMALYCANDGLFVTNTSTLDAAYASDYDTNISGGNGFSVTFWAKGDSGGWTPWFSKYGDSGTAPTSGWQFQSGSQQNKPCWTVRDNSAGTFTVGSGPTWAQNGDQDDLHAAITIDGNWHYYAGTYDPYTGIRNLYIDGVLEGQETGNAPYILAPQCHIAIMADDNQPGDHFGNYNIGEVFDVRVYNYAISAGQAAAVGRVSPKITVTTNNLGQLKLSWPFGHLVSATNLAGPWTSNSAAPPFTIITSPTNAQLYFRVENP